MRGRTVLGQMCHATKVMTTRRHRNKKGVSAWLITWSGTGSSAEWEGRMAAVLDPRLSGDRVKEIVGLIHATSLYTPDEQIRWMIRPEDNPYPPEFGQLRGVTWKGQILCGHNPYLSARLVDELRVETADDGTETPVWEERPRPKLDRTY